MKRRLVISLVSASCASLAPRFVGEIHENQYITAETSPSSVVAERERYDWLMT